MDESYKKKQAESWRKYAKESVIQNKQSKSNVADISKARRSGSFFDRLNSKKVKKSKSSTYDFTNVISPMFGVKSTNDIKNDFNSSKISREGADHKNFYRSVDDYMDKKVKDAEIQKKYPEWCDRWIQNSTSNFRNFSDGPEYNHKTFTEKKQFDTKNNLKKENSNFNSTDKEDITQEHTLFD